MAGFDVKFHPASSINYAPIDELLGVLKVKSQQVGTNGRPVDVDLYGLAFTDPDGETHVYLFTDEGKQTLIAQLTGGIHIAPATLHDLPKQ